MFWGNRKRGQELAEKAADEEDVRKRLAGEAFLGAIPWHFAGKIRVKRIDSLKEASEEAKFRHTLEEEEDSRKKVQAVAEDLRPARQEGRRTREARKGRRGPVCWGCGQPGHALKNCELWKEFNTFSASPISGQVQKFFLENLLLARFLC